MAIFVECLVARHFGLDMLHGGANCFARLPIDGAAVSNTHITGGVTKRHSLTPLVVVHEKLVALTDYLAVAEISILNRHSRPLK